MEPVPNTVTTQSQLLHPEPRYPSRGLSPLPISRESTGNSSSTADEWNYMTICECHGRVEELEKRVKDLESLADKQRRELTELHVLVKKLQELDANSKIHAKPDIVGNPLDIFKMLNLSLPIQP
jgi:hypothetical protein